MALHHAMRWCTQGEHVANRQFASRVNVIRVVCVFLLRLLMVRCVEAQFSDVVEVNVSIFLPMQRIVVDVASHVHQGMTVIHLMEIPVYADVEEMQIVEGVGLATTPAVGIGVIVKATEIV